MEPNGRVAVVAGYGNGVGEAIAHRFAVDGAKVVVADIDPHGGLSEVSQSLGVPASVPTDSTK